MRGPRRKAYALSCTDPQWERIKARAHRHGSRSAARFVVERALSGLAKPRPRLVLGEAEQRQLLERLEWVGDLLAGAADGQASLMASLRHRVGFLLVLQMREEVRSGRGDELRERLARLLPAPEVEALMKRLEGEPGEG